MVWSHPTETNMLICGCFRCQVYIIYKGFKNYETKEYPQVTAKLFWLRVLPMQNGDMKTIKESNLSRMHFQLRNHKTCPPASFVQVTFWSPRWRSLNPWKDHLKHPKGSQQEEPGQIFFSNNEKKSRSFPITRLPTYRILPILCQNVKKAEAEENQGEKWPHGLPGFRQPTEAPTESAVESVKISSQWLHTSEPFAKRQHLLVTFKWIFLKSLKWNVKIWQWFNTARVLKIL